ncbi:MAG: DUF1934 domain-containing protein [Veillonellales bacterium]
MEYVVVTVIGAQKDVYGEENRIESVNIGHYYRKNGIDYIIYQDRELAEAALDVTTMLKVYPDHVVLVRMGGLEQKQEFRLGEKSHSTYATPFGTMQLAVLTKGMDVTFGVASAAIDICYELEVNGQWQSENTLSINVREGQNCGH